MDTGTKKKLNPLLIILSILLVLGTAASCTLGALALRQISAQEAGVSALTEKLAALTGGEETVTQEDDVAVGGEYYIRSTLPVSEAYKSGDASALDSRQAETLEMASGVLEEIISEGMTDYEKEKAVYDWMCANLHHEGGITVVVPTASEYSAEPYGVLKYGQAVCVGFATTFRMFMQMLDLDCMVVHNSYHSWNLVRLDDGWYHVDIYSDVESGDYANFNLTDEMASGGHEWDRGFFPAATGLAYCYAYQNASPLEDIYALPALAREALDRESGPSLYFLVDGLDKAGQQALGELISRTGDAVSDYAAANGRDMWMDYNMQLAEGKMLVSLRIVEYDDAEEPGTELSGEDAERIDEAVSGAFGDVYVPGGDEGWEDYPIDAMPVGEVLE